MTGDGDRPPEPAASNGVKQQSSSLSQSGDVSDSDSGLGNPRAKGYVSNF